MPARRILVGLAAVTVGLAILLDRTGGVGQLLSDLSRWWPLVLVAFGLANLIRLVHRPWGVIGPLIAISAGIVLLLITFDYLNRRDYPLIWPAVLVLVGYGIALAGVDWSDRRLPDENEMRQFVWLRGKRVVSRATNFWRADITVLFGSFELDLRHADLYRKVTVNVNAVFGTVEVIVPPGVTVHQRRPFVLSLAGVEAGVPPPRTARLTVNLLALFGTATVAEATTKEPREDGISTS
jgi:hypothetical protein